MARPDEEPAPETLDPPQELDEPQVFIADEDEDLVIAPPPEPTVFAPRKIAAPRKSGSIEFRRTLIPILLTFGVALPITGAWWFRLDDESPLKVIGVAFPITMIALGVILLGLAVLNMAQVRKLLQPPAPSEDAP